jgi:phenylalanyl-tRNA synthetase beta chain
MRELCSYALYDESFIDLMRWDCEQKLEVQFPVSENMRRPVNSLVPHLLKAVHENAQDHHRLRFFEWGRIWNLDTAINEHKKLSGIIYEQKESVDFYAGKALLSELFDMLGMEVVWKKVDSPKEPWFAPYRTADIILGEKSIGRAGIANFGLLHPLLDRGEAFIFELDGDAILAFQKPIELYVPTSKYPEVERDISMLVPKQATVEEITNIIVQADKSIVAVQLVDFFEKEEWVTQKSLTLRFVLHDERKTLTKAEVDAVYDRVISALITLGAEIR